MKIAFFATAALLATATTAWAIAPSDSIQKRVTGYKALGTAFKIANDTIRSRDFDSANLTKAADIIEKAGRAQYQWFPKGSGPTAGSKTAAKAEIWTNARGFKAAQNSFAAQSKAFKRAVASGDGDLIKSESRKLGAKCKSCHDQFREEDS